MPIKLKNVCRHIPFEIHVEIIKTLPVKSLIQFRSVSKTWKSLIDSSDFIAEYSNQLQHLLVRYTDSDLKQNYVSIIDDDTFPQQKVCLTPPHLTSILKSRKIIGSSHGLLCFYGSDDRDDSFHPKRMAVIWNVSIRKEVAVVVPNSYSTVLGFGVCEKTTDIKIVKIDTSCIRCQVEVFTLNTGTWRPSYGNLPRDSVQFDSFYSPVTVGGCPYWLVIDDITLNGELPFNILIITFDMTNEEFRDVKLPDCIACRHQSLNELKLTKVKESLVLMEHIVESGDVHVWMMDDVVSNSFTKLFTFDINIVYAFERGFRKSGEPIIQIRKRRSHDHKLVVYDPYSKHLNNLGIDGLQDSFLVRSYEETLFLLDHQNLKVYN